jgi:hypothetical protein
MISRLVVTVFVVAFVALVERASAESKPRRRRHAVVTWCALLLAIGLTPLAVFAATLPEGTVVRIESAYIEAGWHQGTLRRAQDRCWMVYLKNATHGGYKLLALTTAKRLQVARGGQWQDASPADNLADQPRACLEEGSD